MKKYSEYFTHKKRNDGLDFICLVDGAPQELEKLMYSIHKDHFDYTLPDDWIYENVYDAFEALETGDDFDSVLQSLEPDIYNVDLCEWLKCGFAQGYCNESLEESEHKNIMQAVQAGNYRAKEVIYFAVRDFLDDQKEVKDD